MNLTEGFNTLANPGIYPAAENGGLLGEGSGSVYPATGAIHTGNEGAKDMWWRAPVFQVGSYKQITNNIRYPRSTDEGRCTPAEFCDTLYHDREPRESNIATVLPPVNDSEGNRVGYFTTN